jgi:hypothetical protein
LKNNTKNNSIEIIAIANYKKSNNNENNKSVENNIIKNKLNDIKNKNEKKRIDIPDLGKRVNTSNLDTNENKKSRYYE